MPVPSFLDTIDVGDVGEPWVGYGTILSDMDDIWPYLGSNTEMKFDLLDLPDADFMLNDCEFDSLFDLGSDDMDRKDIVHHDCMWSGTCSDKSIHSNSPPHLVPQAPKPVFLDYRPPAPQPQPQPAPRPFVNGNGGRSLLISNRRSSPARRPRSPRSSRASPSPAPRPDTPQSLDEAEPPQFRHDVIACCVGSNELPLIIPSDDDDDMDDEHEVCTSPGLSSGASTSASPSESPSASPGPPMRDPRHSTVESDHSYTRSKVTKHDRFDNLGVQTPSDSEEEIDVVSVGTPCQQRSVIGLPTNPSVSDRHKLQRTVATAISSKREGTAEMQTRVPPLRVSVAQPASRKRASAGTATAAGNGCGERSPKAKRPRAGGRRVSRASPPKRRVADSDSESENVEKRSLHNDMERQRRIGLRNLFEQLKREVPATREKERAPKVVILREAASLCTRLQREERERDELRRKQQRLLATVKQLRVQLASVRHHP